MSLDVQLLEKVRRLANGIVQARCPACAEGGGDRAGEHLRLYPDGRFGCCVFPQGRDHRRRIFALAGDKLPRPFTVKVAGTNPVAQSAQSIKATLTRFAGTPGTPILIPRAYTKVGQEIMYDHTHTCKGFEGGVPSVPSPPTVGRLPYLTPSGVLGIPFDSPEQFHWWKGGQSVAKTRSEVESWMAAARKDK